MASTMLCIVVLVSLKILVINARKVEDLTRSSVNSNDVSGTASFPDKCIRKEGCPVLYQGAQPGQKCDSHCRPLKCAWFAVENATHIFIQCGERKRSPVIAKKRADTFLHIRRRRSLSEECREGCYFEEVYEFGGSGQSVIGYMRWYVCYVRSRCPDGYFCTVHGSFGHTSQLHVSCNMHGGWSSWESWSACSVTCESGLKRRERKCNNPTPVGSGSDCAGQDHEISNCRPCTNITDCQISCCNSTIPALCLKCIDLDLYKLDDGDSTCTRKCSWESRWCWPGTCDGDYARTCSCAAGFTRYYDSTQAVCQPILRPNITSCSMRVTASNGDSRASRSIGSSHCDYQQDFYGNFQVDSILTSTAFDYVIDVTDIARPAFVVSEVYGITDVQIHTVKKAVTGVETVIASHTILSDPNSNSPKPHYIPSDQTMAVSHDLYNGQRLCLRFHPKAGGHFTSKNVQDHQTWLERYTKTERTRDLCYIYDDAKPEHCSIGDSCSYDVLMVPFRVSKDRVLNISTSGWTDPFPQGGDTLLSSGIESFRLTIHDVKESSIDKLFMDNRKSEGTSDVYMRQNAMYTIQLPEHEPSIYGLMLEIKDVAGNVRLTRRFILYDNSSRIDVTATYKLYVSSAAENTNYTWQTTHHDICVSWRDRYYNNKYVHFNPLRPIDSDGHGLISPAYDQTSGQLPVSGTSNVHGISHFHYQLHKETNSQTITSDVVSNISSQGVCISHSLNDGDTYRFTLNISDIVGNFFRESIFFYIDTSPPVIADAWLVREGHKQLFVHNSTDLFSMTLEFDSYDSHGGLLQVLWWFYETDPEGLLGHGAQGVKQTDNGTTCPEQQLCICPIVGRCQFFHFIFNLNTLMVNNTHIGNHNRKYRYVIEATNTALLTTSISVDVYVDESPPEDGVIYEGLEGQPDIDYTSDSHISVHWHGFIDHESGIEFYRVALAKTCVQNTDMISFHNFSKTVQFQNTTLSSIQFQVQSLGKYFVTVVAFNRAMEPSSAICSDGFTKIGSPPEIANVRLTNAQTKRHTVCYNGDIWLISAKLTRTNITAETPCPKPCTDTSNGFQLGLLPQDYTQKYSRSACSTISLHHFYLPVDSIRLSWTFVDDNTPISTVHIGFGSTILSVDFPDLQGFETVHQHTFFRRHHLGFTTGTEFYIFIKATNKAGLSTTAIFGPVVIDESPPTCPSSVSFHHNSSHVIANLNDIMFTDTEQREDISYLTYRIHFQNNNGISGFNTWEELDTTTCTNISDCLAFSVEYLQKMVTGVNRSVHIELHAFNIAGHHCTVLSEAIDLPTIYKPSVGAVKDIYPGYTEEPFTDQDVSFSTTEYCVAWTCLSDHVAAVSVDVGLGSSPGIDDVDSFHTVVGRDIHCQSNVNLTRNTTYYAVIRLQNNAGSTLASSDGFTVLSKRDVLNSISVFDGLGCSNQSFLCQWTLHPDDTFLQANASCNQILHIGSQYTVFYQEQLHDAITLTSPDVVFIDSEPGRVAFSPEVHLPVFKITSSLAINYTEIRFRVYRCQEDIDHLHSGAAIAVHWRVYGYTDHITHFVVSLAVNGGNVSIIETIIASSDVRNVTSKRFVTNLLYLVYEVKPCFGVICLPGVASDGFEQELQPHIVSVSAELTDYSSKCSTVRVSWSEARCSVDTEALFYKWGITDSNSGVSPKHNWITHEGNAPNHQSTECIKMTADVFAKRFICLHMFCPSGRTTTKCEHLKIQFHQNKFPKQIVYDIDVDSVDFSELELLVFSSNIGEKLSNIHQLELDYSPNRAELGACIVGLQDREVTWYLMITADIPSDTCDNDINCLIHATTNGGAISFGKLNLDEGKYYVCARSAASTRTRKDFVEHFEKVEGCSDGFIIDETGPSMGSVTIHSNGGYLSDTSELFISWTDFHDNFASASFLQYIYAIGSYPGGRDVQTYRDAGEKQSVLLRNIRLTPGIVYYAMVEARDRVGLTTTAVSDGVSFDDTPPVLGVVSVGDIHVHKHVTTRQNTVMHWKGFSDLESGIQHFEVALGNYVDVADVVSFLRVDPFRSSFGFSHLNLQHGHHYYAFLRVTNRAGLSLVAVSEYFLLDDTPPLPGIVREGPTESNDFAYQRNFSHLVCSWDGFIDPESGIEYYKVGLGTTPGELDVRRLTFVGLSTNMTWSVHLEQGVTYYVTVQACNTGEMCTDVTSNGVLVDHSPPIPGQVLVGRADGHQHYIGQRSHMDVFWVGFFDSHSDIVRYEVCISNNPDPLCDVIPLTNAHLTTEHLFTDLDLPLQSPLYATVFAYNKVGLNTNMTSGMFTIDVTPPVSTQIPVFTSSTTYISVNTSAQWDTSLLQISWMFTDNESPIIRHKLSVTNHHNGHTYIEDKELLNENHTTILLKPEHWLLSGDRYQATVTACNGAGLCTVASSGYLVVDSSPPHIGGFGDDLTWKLDNSDTTVNMMWSGFEDAESGIKLYHITIGETYSGSELSLGYISLVHVGERSDVQYGNFSISKQLQVYSKIILTITAENNAGLMTTATRITTHVLKSDAAGNYGILRIEKHSCDVHYCNKDCTCAALGQKCSDVHSKSCNQTESSDHQSVSIYSGYEAGVHTQHSLSSACLGANLVLSPVQSSLNIIRMEWSMGLENMEYGAGIFDPLLEDVWHDIGMRDSVVHCVSSNNPLLHENTYTVYIRAWYNTDTYRIFRSQPLLIDRTPPKIFRGFHIKDSIDNCETDVEFITETDSLTACWGNGFADSQSGILHYLASLGTSPGAPDASPLRNVGKATNFTWTGLNLHPGSKYYVTVTAVNTLNVSSTVNSDGFIVDTAPPLPGIVFNTKKYRNHQSQASVDTLEASWNGFMDRHSHIDFYKVAIAEKLEARQSLTFQTIGRNTKVTLPGLNLLTGRSYEIIVKAVDASGQESEEVHSPSVLVDPSPPVAYQCNGFVTLFDETREITESTWINVWNISVRKDLSVCSLIITIPESNGDTYMVVTLNDHTFNAHLLHQTFTHVFTVQSEENIRILVKVIDKWENPGNITVTLQGCNNVSFHNYSTHQIPLQQISFSTVSTLLQFVDPESDVRSVELGVGTTVHGYQVQALEPVFTGGYHAFPVKLPHRSPVHVTVVVENTAGLRSYFRSAPLIIDHTPPTISDVLLQYRDVSDRQVVLHITWTVEDKESQYVFCDVSCGSIWRTDTIESDSRAEISVESEPLGIQHGTPIIGTITCKNSVGMIQQTTTNDVTILLEPPGHANSRITFLNTHGSTVTGQAVTRLTENLHFHWDEFDYPVGKVKYQYRIDFMNGSRSSWVDVGYRNFVTSHVLNVADDSECGLEVRGSNERGLISGSINATIYVLRQPPSLTGTPCNGPVVGRGSASLNCSLVFNVTGLLRTSYVLTVGTKLGFSDVVKYRVFDDNVFTFLFNDDDIAELFVMVTAVYDTGAETTYRDTFYIS
ncbi:uncharacterized protein [Argopecten irradians]|uniref:uncharacterized protein isoform X2 n=1 Tax=Argopecten irradians TaxID=31199 RepID=UPI0037219827